MATFIDPPQGPIAPPVLIPERKSSKPGQFVVDLSSAAPRPPEGESVDIHPVTFLFKFEEVNSSNVFYNWSVSVCMIL